MTKQNVVYTHDRMLFGHKEEWSTNPCYNMDEPWRRHAQWKKQTWTQKATSWMIPFMWCNLIFHKSCLDLVLEFCLKILFSLPFLGSLLSTPPLLSPLLGPLSLGPLNTFLQSPLIRRPHSGARYQTTRNSRHAPEPKKSSKLANAQGPRRNYLPLPQVPPPRPGHVAASFPSEL